jgi:hypothetical protein
MEFITFPTPVENQQMYLTKLGNKQLWKKKKKKTGIYNIPYFCGKPAVVSQLESLNTSETLD